MKDKISHFQKLFTEETLERLQKISNFAVEFEKNPDDTDLAEKIKREMHTIKGGARIVGFTSLSELAHHFEDIFKGVLELGDKLPKDWIDKLFSAIDLMKELLSLGQNQKSEEKVRTFIEKKRGKKNSDEKLLDSKKGSLKEELAKKLSSRIKKEAPATGTEHEKSEKKATATEKRKRKKSEKEKFSFSRSFRIESSFIDAIAEGALHLKAMTSFFDHFVADYNKIAKSLREFRMDLANTLKKIPPGQVKEELEMVLIHLRDLEKTTLAKQRTTSSKIHAFQNSFQSFYSSVEELKLIPLVTIFSIYPRFVRDYAQEHGKQIEFTYEGGATRLDKRIAEAINDSLIHILRNAVDHGIEAPEKRIKSDKKSVGKITLRAKTLGNKVKIEITDDGSGFNIEKIREKAIEKNIISNNEQINDNTLINLTKKPGFSTASIITDTSGRGIGLDVVENAIKQFNGKLSIHSKEGQGTTIEIELPVSISTTPIIQVKDREEIYGIPVNQIDKIVKQDLTSLSKKESIYYLIENNRSLPITYLSQILGIGENQNKTRSMVHPLVIIKTVKGKFGILVDRILTEDEAIIYRLDPFINGLEIFSGFTVTLFGEPFPIINIDIIPKYFESIQKGVATYEKTPSSKARRKVILLVEDSLVTREMEKVILESAGFKVVEASNGMEAFDKLSTHTVDCVVTDVEMPLMDGFTLTEKLRNLSAFKKLPVIIVTTRENRQDKIKGIQVGANAYITKKDFDQMKLIETIQRLVF